MNYEIVELKETKVAGFTAVTNNTSPDMGAVIGGLWQKFFTEDGYAAMPHKVSGKTMGIYTDYESDELGDYTFMTGCAVEGDVPDKFEVRTLPAGKYAKFVVVGNMMTAVGEFWKKLREMKLERTYVFDFEEYQNADPENCEIHIYIGIK
ncbi:GyrI-like domain-containing protein [Ruminococcus sp.]|uniref:GyrI-like domain-containing protein n=1 Tax=Ruminococcus sp. TaxID=41978 RepID=UPI0025DF0221|nr:GyrI-like domain-containing protein [Ruminococcus sp.]MBQ8968032.1 effector binding domain-containing protein [Ruminococcus sp.]